MVTWGKNETRKGGSVIWKYGGEKKGRRKWRAKEKEGRGERRPDASSEWKAVTVAIRPRIGDETIGWGRGKRREKMKERERDRERERYYQEKGRIRAK